MLSGVQKNLARLISNRLLLSTFKVETTIYSEKTMSTTDPAILTLTPSQPM